MEIFLKCVPIVSCPSIFEIHVSECQCCVISVLHSPDMKHFNRSCSSMNLSNQKSLPQTIGKKKVSPLICLKTYGELVWVKEWGWIWQFSPLKFKFELGYK